MSDVIESEEVRPQCPACGKRLPPFSGLGTLRLRGYRPKRTVSLTADGKEAAWGSFGDNLVCNTKCGHQLLIKLAASIGVVDMLNLLPPGWRKDQEPPPVKKSPRFEETKADRDRRNRLARSRRSPLRYR